MEPPQASEMLQERLKLAEYIQTLHQLHSLLQNPLGTVWVQDRSLSKGTSAFETASQGSYTRLQVHP